jgi:hypothetical protein
VLRSFVEAFLLEVLALARADLARHAEDRVQDEDARRRAELRRALLAGELLKGPAPRRQLPRA